MFWKKYKREAPAETIRKMKRPDLESVYLKSRGKNLKHISFFRETDTVSFLGAPRFLQYLFGGKNKMIIHTHSKDAIPSGGDINRFLDDAYGYSGIAQRNVETGEVEGYLIMKKTKDTPRLNKGKISRIRKYGRGKNSLGFKRLAEDLNFKYKFIPAKGYKIDLQSMKFVPRESQTLESKVASIIGISTLILSLIFLSQNLTGNAIANLSTKTSGIIGVGLFIVGIVGSYFWFNKK